MNKYIRNSEILHEQILSVFGIGYSVKFTVASWSPLAAFVSLSTPRNFLKEMSVQLVSAPDQTTVCVCSRVVPPTLLIFFLLFSAMSLSASSSARMVIFVVMEERLLPNFLTRLWSCVEHASNTLYYVQPLASYVLWELQGWSMWNMYQPICYSV